MGIVHPFHPLSGQRLPRVGERCNAFGRRILCLDGEGALWAVPVEWTDLAPLDAEYEIGARRTYFLVGDLLGLAELVALA